MGRNAAKRPALILTCFAILCAAGTPAQAQNGGDGGARGPQGGPGGPGGRPPGTGIGRKLREEKAAIRQGVQNGTISPEQAQKLRQNVAGIAQQAAAARAQNGGQLNPNQVKQIKNELRQTKELIQNATGAGTSTVQRPGAGDGLTGPNWAPGPDGAQDPAALKRGMKTEERRELRQERQATEQVQEQQQLDYEKQMTQKLGQQRKAITQDKKQVQKERNQYGAN